MDDFLTKLYNEELEKNASAGREALFEQLPASDLEEFLGLEKVAVGGKPEGVDVPPEFEKAFKAREAKGRDAQQQMATAYSKSETVPARNIAPFKAGETVPERNINPQNPQISSSAASLPESTVTPKYEGMGKSAEAALQWADDMGRSLAHMEKEGSAPFLTKIADHISQSQREKLPSKDFAVPERKAKKLGVEGEVKGEAKGKYPVDTKNRAENALGRVSQFGSPGERQAVRSKVYSKFPELKKRFEERHGGANPTSKKNVEKEEQGGIGKGSCAMGKAAAAMLGIKLAYQLPDGMRSAVIGATARQMVKAASRG